MSTLAKSVLYFVTGQMKGHTDKVYKLCLTQLKEEMVAIDAALKSPYLMGDSLNLADVALFSALYYPMMFALDNGFRNKVKNLTAWFNSIRERDEVR